MTTGLHFDNSTAHGGTPGGPTAAYANGNRRPILAAAEQQPPAAPTAPPRPPYGRHAVTAAAAGRRAVRAATAGLRRTRDVTLQLAGFGAIAWGAAGVYEPAGYITAGAALLYLQWLAADTDVDTEHGDRP
jgi:hypothetical protein